MHFLPWWLLVAYLAASAFAAYLLLGRTQVGDSRWALFALTAVVASLLLAGAMAAAIALSTLLSAFPGDRTAGPPEPAAKTERTEVEAPPEGTDLRTTLEWTSPETGSPSASPNAAADASPPPASASAMVSL